VQKLVYISNPFKFSPKQLKSLAEIANDVAQIFLATWVIGPVVTRNFNGLLGVFGLILSFVGWYVNLSLMRRLEL